MKKNGWIRLAFIMVFTMITNMFGGNIEVTYASASTPDSSPISVIKQQFEAQSQQDWNRIPDLWIASEREIYREFVSNPENQKNHVGMFAIQSAKMVGVKELPYESARNYTYVDH